MPGSAGARGTGGPSPLPSPLPRHFGTDEPEPLHHFQFSFMERSTCCHLLPNAQCKSAFTFMVLINLIISCARWAGERQAPVPCSRPPLTKSIRFQGKKQLRAWNWGELRPGVQIPYCHWGISCEFINIAVLLPCGYPRLQLPGRRAGLAPTGPPTALSLLEQAHHHHFFFPDFFSDFFLLPIQGNPPGFPYSILGLKPLLDVPAMVEQTRHLGSPGTRSLEQLGLPLLCLQGGFNFVWFAFPHQAVKIFYLRKTTFFPLFFL